MSYRCPQCGIEYDATLFQFGIPFRCACGAIVRPEHSQAATEESAKADAARREEEVYREFQRAADRIAFLIVATDYPQVDVEIERRNLRRLCRRIYPDRGELFEMIYEARFRRLWSQFRTSEGR
jgi:hypothetical protein